MKNEVSDKELTTVGELIECLRELPAKMKIVCFRIELENRLNHHRIIERNDVKK